jgi:hypothetical protein
MCIIVPVAGSIVTVLGMNENQRLNEFWGVSGGKDPTTTVEDDGGSNSCGLVGMEDTGILFLIRHHLQSYL